MKIGYSLEAYGKGSGLNVYTTSLYKSLKKLTDDVVPVGMRIGQENTLERIAYENISLPNELRHSDIDILHIPAFCPPLLKRFKTVLTVHDIIGMQFNNQRGLASRFYWGAYYKHAINTLI